jgi:hypothetical protein
MEAGELQTAIAHLKDKLQVLAIAQRLPPSHATAFKHRRGGVAKRGTRMESGTETRLRSEMVNFRWGAGVGGLTPAVAWMASGGAARHGGRGWGGVGGWNGRAGAGGGARQRAEAGPGEPGNLHTAREAGGHHPAAQSCEPNKGGERDSNPPLHGPTEDSSGPTRAGPAHSARPACPVPLRPVHLRCRCRSDPNPPAQGWGGGPG